jgi:glycosyltransferase involved in cell wall biosynthesis
MHVLVIPSWYPTPFQPLNGTFFQEQAQALTEKHRVGIIYPALRPLTTVLDGGLEWGVSRSKEGPLVVHRSFAWNVPKARRLQRIRSIRGFRRLFELYRDSEGTPDILHAHSSVWGGDAAREISNATGVPFVVTEHSTGFRTGMYDGWQGKHVERVFSSADAVIAVSHSLKQSLSKYIDGSTISVIPNSVNTEHFGTGVRTDESGPFRFACISFVNRRKRIDLLIRAFDRSFDAAERVVLDIIGEGPARVELEGLSRRLGLKDRVRFVGPVHRHDLPNALANAHCLVSSSQVETFGVTLIEALASGIPVISTRSGGPEDIVTSEVGHLVPVDDEVALGAAMRQVYENRVTWGRRAPELKRFARERFGAAAVTRRVVDVYSSVIEARAR